MNDDIEIPIIEINDGWTVDDVITENDCDDAFALLTSIVAAIEERMDILDAQGEKQSIQYIKAKAALRYKRAALNIVNIKRGRLKRQQKLDEQELIIDYIAAHHEPIMKQARLYIKMNSGQVLQKAAG
ncbi:hypothetical protein [uncultured Ruegeria sp.]|uniref:hypothetical protein n=1 Tax=uncultured Ruegeria sp. TaxID=259304 RepID=UPI002604A04B|nr:hypothetical protein [uncultured Ruegeria sp.]